MWCESQRLNYIYEFIIIYCDQFGLFANNVLKHAHIHSKLYTKYVENVS